MSQPTKRAGVSVIGAVAGMLITFIGGVYVGLHPSWIPIKVSNGVEMTPVEPGMNTGPGSRTDGHGSIDMPTTMPSTMPAITH